MQLVRTLSLIGGLAGALFVASCGGKSSNKNSDAPAAPAAVSFADASPILDQKCASCHTSKSGGKAIRGFSLQRADGTIDEGAVKTRAKDMASLIQSDQMPAQHLLPTADQQATFVAFFNKQAGAATFDTAGFNANIKPITDSTCIGCHRAKGKLPEVGSPDAYAKDATLAAKSASEVSTQQMPPPNPPKLTDDEKSKLLSYLGTL